ncbi:stage V sporulation protein AA [Natronincola ferrireducens]|uniref:Stage V sporulation protein AA n=1 Tax=Natronincola ferrireducens TaxID=393762 RepID=A0A1G9D7Y9_9FIRM|nr:stage V sporulation protein AA [Natronincola ferrireducens]SDK59834.1 stage V sporulation protein AA [Natronincola ferrireducens]
MTNQSHNQIYIHTKGKIKINASKTIFLKDLVDVYIEDTITKKKIEDIKYEIEDLHNKNNHLIGILSIIALIKKYYPTSAITVIGEPNILVTIENNEMVAKDRKKTLRVALVCFLLFVGSMTAIINFHSDVDMLQTQKTIYRIITGEETDNLLLLQIPYSLGIGIGMSVFFNHFFKKKINNEPSPLEVEVHLYQENLDQYIKNNSEKHNK